ncbi:hypothetical protein R1sor_025847 [Riccia sorocarpa]|uniref:Protein kinase domain-containing protein n=1 Tax=Riccia sorocarpa TaxID=122646 RepID=A0ABD3GBT5_9MARC
MAFFPPVDNNTHKYCYKFDLSLSNRESKNYLLRAVFPTARIGIAGHGDIIEQRVGNTGLADFYVAVDATTVYELRWNWTDVVHESEIVELFVRSIDDNSAGRTVTQSTPGLSYFLTLSRLNFGGNDLSPALRFPSDRYDRLWYGTGTPVAMNSSNSTNVGRVVPVIINTASEVESKSIDPNTVFSGQLQDDQFEVPPLVWSSAWEAVDLDSVISFTVNPLSIQGGLSSYTSSLQQENSFTLNFVLFDVDPDNSNSRSVDIYNADLKYEDVYAGKWLAQAVDVPKAERKVVCEMTYQFSTDTTVFNISRAATSSRPAMVNAFELYVAITGEYKSNDELTIRSFANLLSSQESLDTFGDPCKPSPWSWIKCGSTPLFTFITEIDLSNQGLAGEFMADIQLPELLRVLNLSNNKFSGLLPFALGNQSLPEELVIVDLSDNNFTGPVPMFSVLDMKAGLNLEFLNLSSNYMTGNVMNFSEGLVLLRILDLSDNDFSGPFPAFPNASLEFLNLVSNHMSGTISAMLYSLDFELQPLRALILRKNNFSGMVPDGIWGPTSQLERVNLLSGLQFQRDSDIYKLLQRSGGYILLGGNEWCERVGLPEVRILERYLCRYSESEDYYWKYLEGTRNEHLIIGLSVSGSVVLLIACFLLILLARVWKRVKLLRQIQEELAKEDVRPPFYKYEDLRTATRHFSQKNELGKGGFGAVYKAEFANSSIVAVKLLFPTEQNLKDFLKEAVLITGTKHRNLVQLKGCCIRDKKRMLVYEYAENRNLAQALWGKDGSSPLTWAQRLKICVGVAKGLSYLHEELQPKVIHKDIKPQNILLDKDWNAKIADFQMARPMKGDEGTQATRVGGTVGYLAPEYAIQGLITEKLDVYSYGILLLQIISGRKCFDSSAASDEFYLQTWAFKLYRVGCLLSIAEQNLLAVTSAEEIESVLKIALSCVQVVHDKRPSMSEVVIMLTSNSSGVAVEVVEKLIDQQVLSDSPYEPF